MDDGPSDPGVCLLELDAGRRRIAGDETALAAAVRRGADLRIYTEFAWHEHIELGSPNTELVRELSEFRVTYLLDDRWVAAIMNWRVPITPMSFGAEPRMSFFLYNQDGSQACASPRLDSAAPEPEAAEQGTWPVKYRVLDAHDQGTRAPSHNFVYRFDRYRFCVSERWREVLAHDERGGVRTGSIDALGEALREGRELKVAVSGLCADLGGATPHEVFVHVGASWHMTESGTVVAGTHPLVRVAPAIPLRYRAGGWDFGWLLAGTDGRVQQRLVEPATGAFRERESAHPVRWFAREEGGAYGSRTARR